MGGVVPGEGRHFGGSTGPRSNVGLGFWAVPSVPLSPHLEGRERAQSPGTEPDDPPRALYPMAQSPCGQNGATPMAVPPSSCYLLLGQGPRGVAAWQSPSCVCRFAG